MKKLVLFTVFLALLSSVLQAQKRPPAKKEVTKISFTRHYLDAVDQEPPMLNPPSAVNAPKSSRVLGEETEIIETIYDFQSNASIANRFIVWNDGTMAAVCTRGVENPTNNAFPDRGTGYNFFNGTSWGPKPTTRIETVRTGWPSIAKAGPNGEIVIAHTSGTNTLRVNYRTNKGTGSWTEYPFFTPPTGATGLLWPRIISSGTNNNYIHLFVLTSPTGNGGTPYLGQDGALLYYRSSDAGLTWDKQAVLIEGLGSDFYNNIRSDCYSLASKGNMVVLLHGSAWADMFLLKSYDNGETWQKIMIWEHPYPFFDFNTTLTTDTLYSCDNSSCLAIDDNGMVHVAWGISRVARLIYNPPDPGYYTYWPYTDGIGYWNESMGQIPDAPNVHHTMKPEYLESMGMLIGWTQDVNNSGFIFDFEGTASPPFNVYRSLGISCMPTLAIQGNMITLVYASVTETFVTADGTKNYKHLWTRTSYNLGQTWGQFRDLQADNIFHLFDECIYPILAHQPASNGAFQLIYMADNYPGLFSFDNNHDPTINRIIHNNMSFTIGIEEQPTLTSAFDLLPVAPNPVTSNAFIRFNLQSTSDIHLKVYNASGREIFTNPPRTFYPGLNSIKVDVGSWAPGIYFCSLSDGQTTKSVKMVVQ